MGSSSSRLVGSTSSSYPVATIASSSYPVATIITLAEAVGGLVGRALGAPRQSVSSPAGSPRFIDSFDRSSETGELPP